MSRFEQMPTSETPPPIPASMRRPEPGIPPSTAQLTGFEESLRRLAEGYGDIATYLTIQAFWMGMKACAAVTYNDQSRQATVAMADYMILFTQEAQKRYEQLAKDLAKAQKAYRDARGREPDAAPDPSLGADGAGQNPHEGKDRGDEDPGGGPEERAVETPGIPLVEGQREDRDRRNSVREMMSHHLTSSRISPLEGQVGIALRYAELLRSLAQSIAVKAREKQERGLTRLDTPLPSIIVAGMPFQPTLDGMHLELYAFARVEDFDALRWVIFPDHDHA